MKKITLIIAFFASCLLINAQENSFFSVNSSGGVSVSTLDQNRAPVVITQSNTQNNVEANAIACASPTSFRNNNLFRAFDLPVQFSISNGLEVTAVEFAIGPISTPAGFPITINIYSTPSPVAFPSGTLTLQGSAVHVATNADFLSIVNLPLIALIPAGEAMVMEAVIIDDTTDTNFMRFGCNNDGQTGPSYIQAPNCGAPTPTDFAALGLTQGLVWNVLGDDEPLSIIDNALSQVSLFPNPATDIINVKVPSNVIIIGAVLYDVLGKNTGITISNGSMNVANLSRGVYILSLETSAGTLTKKIVKK